MEIIKNIYWLGGIFIFGIVSTMGFVLPHTLRVLRNPRTYKRALITSVVLLLIGIGLQFDKNYNCLERRNLLYPIYGIVYLFLYKVSDNFIQKKKGRHMYYLTIRYIKDEESNNSTAIENLIQLINYIITFGLSYYGSMMIISMIYNSCS